MKRLLLLSFHFPPQPEAGALRSGYLADNIGAEDWEPTVITVPYGVPLSKTYMVVPARSPLTPALRANLATTLPQESKPTSLGGRAAMQSTVRHALAKAYYRCSRYWYPDPAVGWIGDALYRSLRLHKASPFSAVFSTAWPASAHLTAAAFSAVTGVPWLADYRDLWAGYPYRSISGVRAWFDRTVERRVLRGAAAITTVSEGLRASLAALHQRNDVEVIPNAAAAEDWADVPDQDPQRFNILYAGVLYGGQRTPDLIFAAAAELRAECDPAGLAVSFDFYGAERNLVLSAAEKYGIGDCVRVHERVNRAAVLRRQKGAAALLVLLKMDPMLANEFGSKIYEYAGARRPILAVGPAGSVVGDYLNQSGLGTLVSTRLECKKALQVFYGDFRNGRYVRDVVPQWKPFTSADLAARFAAVLNRISE